MKKTVIVDAPGKVNLALDVTGKRPDGYHTIDTIMQAVDLCDTVTISRMSGKGIYISCDRQMIPCDETNYAHIAARKFFERFGQPDTAISIDIQKRIPVQAGLAGGSADAAGVLVGLNALFGTGADRGTLCEIGVQVGADVPFCIVGGTRRARGIGNEFTPLPPLPACHILIAKPGPGMSTPESYRRYNERGVKRRPDMPALLRQLEAGELRAFARGMVNVLEEVADLPEIPFLRERMCEAGALGALMSGSGSAVFGIFEDRGPAKHCMRRLYSHAEAVFLSRAVTYGAVVLDLLDREP